MNQLLIYLIFISSHFLFSFSRACNLFSSYFFFILLFLLSSYLSIHNFPHGNETLIASATTYNTRPQFGSNLKPVGNKAKENISRRRLAIWLFALAELSSFILSHLHPLSISIRYPSILFVICHNFVSTPVAYKS